MNDVKKSALLLYADDHNIHHQVKRIMKSLYYARIQALNNKELASVTSRIAIGKNLVGSIPEFAYLAQTFRNKEASSFTGTGLHMSQVIGKFIEMRQVPTDCKVNKTTKLKLIFSLIWNKVYECTNNPETFWI